MPREHDPPYVAAGFWEDAGRLIEQFLAKRTVEFSKFAEVWREMKFSLIFMGRETLRELIEIWVSVKQLYYFYELEQYYMEGDIDPIVLDLSYVITKLFKMEAFHVSCLLIPMGPVVPIPLLRLEPLRNSDFKEVLGTLSMLNDKDIKTVVDLTRQYEKLKKMLPCLCSASKITAGLNRFSKLKETISVLEDRYNAGLLPNKVDGDEKMEEEFYKKLGRRRSMLKTQQYQKAAEVGMSRRIRTTSSDSSPSKSSTPVKRGRGRPRKERKRGRKKITANVEVRVRNEVECDSEIEDDLQAEIVDNPDETNDQTEAPQKQPKIPKPVRRHYFEED